MKLGDVFTDAEVARLYRYRAWTAPRDAGRSGLDPQLVDRLYQVGLDPGRPRRSSRPPHWIWPGMTC